MSTYYTPDISEFHVGFEYETKDVPPPEDDWVAEIYSVYASAQLTEKWISEGSIRVKVLDGDDIFDLGWQDFRKSNGYFTIQRSREKRDTPDTFILRFTSPYVFISDERGYFQYFAGKVRNKSELRKVMEMIDIPVNDKNHKP